MSGLDLPAYLARIGLPEAPSRTADGLARLHDHQLRAIPFENFDVLLKRPMSLDLAALEQKMVRSRRGGYCYEANGLMLAALRAIGFDARPLLGRVFFGRSLESGAAPRSHQVSLVHLEGQTFVVDVGFGGLSPRAPLVLEFDLVQVQAPDAYRYRADAEFGWMLEWKPSSEDTGSEEGWSRLYAFTLDRAYHDDLLQAHHFTSTHPTSPFVLGARVCRTVPGGRLAIGGDRFTRRAGNENTHGPLPRGEALLRWLDGTFGIRLENVSGAELEKALFLA